MGTSLRSSRWISETHQRAAPLVFPTSHAVMTRSVSVRPEDTATMLQLSMGELYLQRMHRRLKASDRHVGVINANCTARNEGLEGQLDNSGEG